jgi:hypothetical protein
MSRFGILIISLLPVILLALWAVYVLVTRRAKRVALSSGRDDAVERPELTGPEQHKRRKIP